MASTVQQTLFFGLMPASMALGATPQQTMRGISNCPENWLKCLLSMHLSSLQPPSPFIGY
eukprot:3131349-Ditylum_brightwellii.AAC.1